MQLQAIVEQEIILRHPIVALSRNFCKLIHTKNLYNLSIALLRIICEGIGLKVDDVSSIDGPLGTL